MQAPPKFIPIEEAPPCPPELCDANGRPLIEWNDCVAIGEDGREYVELNPASALDGP